MKVLLGFTVMIGCTVAANLLMKMGAMTQIQQRLFGVVDWKTLVGLGSFAAAALIYARILAFLPLNIAQSFAAAQFVAVILASDIFLSEPIPAGRWLGIALISLGIIIVSVTGGVSVASNVSR